MNNGISETQSFQLREADLLNIEFTITPIERGRINYFSGHLIRGAFLSMLTRGNEELVSGLHDDKNIRPYSVSPISLRFYGDKRDALYEVYPEKQLHFRLSSLSRRVSGPLLQAAMSAQGRTIKIGETHCVVDRVNFTTLDYLEMIRAESCPDSHEFRFLSPTIFEIRAQTFPMLFPLPTYVFGSLASIWNRFAPEESHLALDDMMEQIRSGVCATQHKIRTTQVRIKGHIPISGFVGRVRYKVAREVPNSVKNVVALLSRFAPFSGIGAKRSFGFGAVNTTEC